MKLLNTQAKEKANMGDKWEPYQWQVLPRGGPYELAEVIGAIAPLYSKGKRKGEHNFDKMDRSTKKTIYITTAENAAFVEKWQRETGLCANCEGKGKTLKSWHNVNGVEYQDCKDCAGTGNFTEKKL